MCNCDNYGNDKTSKQVYRFMEDKDISYVTGIGLFLVPNPEEGIYEFKRVMVPDLTLADTIKRGLNCKASKFIPYGFTIENKKIDSIKDLQNIKCKEYTCPSQCPDSCWCNMNRCS